MTVTCNTCGKQFRTRYNLIIHMTVHTGEKPHTCNFCGKGFQQRWNLVTHVSRVHSGDRPFSCADCDRSFGYKSHFKAHVRSHFLAQLKVPTTIKEKLLNPHSCEICSRSFETSSLLSQHLPTHTKEKHFECDGCGMSFTTKRNLSNHILRPCHLLPQLRVKMKPDKGRKQATPCEVCGITIAPYNMHKHMNRHTRRRIYPCHYCGREFLESGHRQVHERTHSGTKPNVCEFCEKAFAQVGNLWIHRRKVHNANDKPARKLKKPEIRRTYLAPNELISGCRNNKEIKDQQEKRKCKVAEVDERQSKLSDQIHYPKLVEDSPTEVSNGHLLEEEVNSQRSLSSAGGHTIREFVNLAAEWINNIKQKSDKEDENSREGEMDIMDTPHEEAESLIATAKKELWEKILKEMGDKDKVKEALKKIVKKKNVDYTLRLLRFLSPLPTNNIVSCNPSGGFIWNCWDCQAKLKSRYKLVRHRIGHLRPYKCNSCQRTFTQAGNLQYHMLVHRGEHRFICERCGKPFRHKSHLITHRQQHDKPGAQQTFQCATCEKTVQSRYLLIQHIRTHSAQEQYQCQTCGKQYNGISAYNRHLKTHERHREKCLVCNMTFSDISSRKRHMFLHDMSKRYPCVCGLSFTQRSSLHRHQPICPKTTSTPSRPFQCSVCPKTFFLAHGLKRHAATHNVLRTFSCTQCNLMLKTSETLMRHMRRRHKNDNMKALSKIWYMWAFKWRKVLLGHCRYSTIFALSSGQGKSGVAVIRVSGQEAENVILRMTRRRTLPPPRQAVLTSVLHPATQEKIDQGLILWFPGPHSFTGEDVCELQVHGGPAVITAVLNGLSCLPSFRPAAPGEFTKRAFMAGRMDLTEVEGLADLIHAETEQQRRQALLQMEGSLSTLYSQWRTDLIRCIAHVEAYIDFSEEDNIEQDVLAQAKASLKLLAERIEAHLQDGRRGERLHNGVRTAIIGQPNVGKSSLLNFVVGRAAAIVAPVSGTTRDVVEVPVNVHGYPLLLADTAGQRQDATDFIEQEGILRARNWTKSADLAVIVLDATEVKKVNNWKDTLKEHKENLHIHTTETLLVINKIDLLSIPEKQHLLVNLPLEACGVSCISREGFDGFFKMLRHKLKLLCGNPSRESPSLTQERHRHHLKECLQNIKQGTTKCSETDVSLAAHCLRKSLHNLGEITGHVTTEQILGVIFKDFCVGK